MTRAAQRVVRHPIKVYKAWRMIGLRPWCSVRFMLTALLGSLMEWRIK